MGVAHSYCYELLTVLSYGYLLWSVFSLMLGASTGNLSQSFIKSHKKVCQTQTSTCRDESVKNQPNKTGTTLQYFYTIPTSCAILPTACLCLLEEGCLVLGRVWCGCVVHVLLCIVSRLCCWWLPVCCYWARQVWSVLCAEGVEWWVCAVCWSVHYVVKFYCCLWVVLYTDGCEVSSGKFVMPC